MVFHEDSSDGQKTKYPSTQYKIQLSATPGTRIGLLAVDQSVYLLRNRKKLNKKKVSDKSRQQRELFTWIDSYVRDIYHFPWDIDSKAQACHSKLFFEIVIKYLSSVLMCNRHGFATSWILIHFFYQQLWEAITFIIKKKHGIEYQENQKKIENQKQGNKN